jgi:hypothetical protein
MGSGRVMADGWGPAPVKAVGLFNAGSTGWEAKARGAPANPGRA